MRLSRLFPFALAALVGCASAPPVTPQPMPAPEPPPSRQQRADTFLDAYYKDLSLHEKATALAYWKAANSGTSEDFDAYSKEELARRMIHNDPERYATLRSILVDPGELDQLTARGLAIADLAFRAEQLPAELTKRLVDGQAEIEQIFASFRATIDGKELTTNDLLDLLKKEKRSAQRQAIWEASKGVGAVIAPKVVELAKVRNEAARKLGFGNYWEMQMMLQEWDPVELLAVFDALERETNAPFLAMKAKLDAEVGKRLGLKPKDLRPWHYDDLFFQDVPSPANLDLDAFFKAFSKEDMVAAGQRFYDDIGLDSSTLVAGSDFYERPGKNQHAFCMTVDRLADVRMLLNIKPTMSWMETMLHETGHGLYYLGIDRSLPYNLREAAHIFTTEGVAMLFGALSKNPVWLSTYAKADPKLIKKFENVLLEQRRREQLVFARWGTVMLQFEKALYENPDADHDATWAAMVARYQGLNPPQGRKGDWAAKPHFTIAPVYYHNYVVGELFAAGVRRHLARMANHTGKPALLAFNGRKDFGGWMTEKIFTPGMSLPWAEFVKNAIGEKLSPDAFVAEVK